MLYYIIIAVIVIAVAAGVVYNFKRSQKIDREGVEADAVVSRVKEIEKENEEGIHDVEYQYYVRYRSQSGETVEARLGNPPRFLTEGTQLRVKYLPEKPKYALMVKR